MKQFHDPQTQLWEEGPTDINKWRSKCLDLPRGNISISFVVLIGSGQHAHIALDDIELLTHSCDQEASEFILDILFVSSSLITLILIVHLLTSFNPLINLLTSCLLLKQLSAY